MGYGCDVVVDGIWYSIKITVHTEVKLVLLIEGLNDQQTLCHQLLTGVNTVCVHTFHVDQTPYGVPYPHENTALYYRI